MFTTCFENCGKSMITMKMTPKGTFTVKMEDLTPLLWIYFEADKGRTDYKSPGCLSTYHYDAQIKFLMIL